MVNNHTDLLRSIRAYLTTAEWSDGIQVVLDGGRRSLPVLGELLREDETIERTERLESLYKAILRAELGKPMSGSVARELAGFQKGLGFVLKYKSYAIKAATPLGYSIFIQNEREGFSFQRHIKHKLEVFHILDVKPGGFVFLCDFRYWKMVYERRVFENWLAGESNGLFDPYRFVPRPGDVFVISELGVVHTVVGCVLEEYATVSTDMVERLHDQNAGKGIPHTFTRANAEAVLRAIEPPVCNRVVRGFEDRAIESLDPIAVG
jgi:hypothetical protein